MRILALACALLAGPALADVTSAKYTDPTERYTHAILGDGVEWGGLEMQTAKGQTLKITLPQTHVFEDVAPRIVDIDLDGDGEVMVVETNMSRGARLAIYDQDGLVAATPYIGTRFRWLAPIGAADLDGDGAVEVAYIDRPHLAKTLRVWRYQDGALVNVANLPGLTNHRIGEPDIGGGLRDCGDGVQMIVADATWQNVMSVTFDGQALNATRLGPHTNRSSFTPHLTC